MIFIRIPFLLHQIFHNIQKEPMVLRYMEKRNEIQLDITATGTLETTNKIEPIKNKIKKNLVIYKIFRYIL